MATLVLNGERIEIDVGETLFAGADRSARGHRAIASSCERRGTCKECIVEIKSGAGALSERSDHEAFLNRPAEIEGRTFRLACQAKVCCAEAVIEVETFKRHLQIDTSGRSAHYAPDPWVRLSDGAVWRDGRRIAEHTGPIHGLSLDVGTSTVVMDAVDLQTGAVIAQRAFENPQQYGGSDVIHRISYDAVHPGQLHRTIISHVNDALRAMPIDRRSIFAVAVAGNPTMRDLFFGLDVQTIGRKPFISRTQVELEAGRRESTALWAEAGDLNLAVHPKAQVYGLPLISHHVGADMAAVLGTLLPDLPDKPFMVVDIGTNTEVAVGNGGRLLCASCPAGPAFEGGRLSCGMPAADGAITELRRSNGGWEMTRIGNVAPRGICGSGLVDILAELRRSGEMDALGRFGNRTMRIPVCERSGVFFTRSDASQLAQAKAANGVGQAILLRRLGIDASRIDKYFLAGAFANHINLSHARLIGLILPVPDERIVRIGNASIEGAKAVLFSRDCRDRIEEFVRRIEHVELEQEPDFFEQYAEMTQIQPIAEGGST